MCQRLESSLKPRFSRCQRSWPQSWILAAGMVAAGRSVTQIQVLFSRTSSVFPPTTLCLSVSSSAQTTRTGRSSGGKEVRPGMSQRRGGGIERGEGSEVWDVPEAGGSGAIDQDLRLDEVPQSFCDPVQVSPFLLDDDDGVLARIEHQLEEGRFEIQGVCADDVDQAGVLEQDSFQQAAGRHEDR